MRFSRVLRLNPRTKTDALKNELSKPLWEFAPGQIAGKPTQYAGPPVDGRYEREHDRIHTPRLAPHLGISFRITYTVQVISYKLYGIMNLQQVFRSVVFVGWNPARHRTSWICE